MSEIDWDKVEAMDKEAAEYAELARAKDGITLLDFYRPTISRVPPAPSPGEVEAMFKADCKKD